LALGLGGTGIATAQPLDDRLAAVADDVPSFAGMFVNQGAGVLHVYLADPGPHAPARAEETLRHVFAAQRLPGRVKVHTGRFSFRRLDAWHGRLSARVLGIRGVVLTDVDDAEDRLTVGVRNRASRARVKRRLGTLAIPREAVAIERMAPIEAEVTLRSRRRPLVGGMQIASRISSSDQFLCTLGFNAIRAGVRGYVTNSHCTRSQGGAESTVFHQPTSFTPGNKIGVEAIDRPYFTGGACPATRRCRYSDTAFVRRDPPGVRVSQGLLQHHRVGSLHEGLPAGERGGRGRRQRRAKGGPHHGHDERKGDPYLRQHPRRGHEHHPAVSKPGDLQIRRWRQRIAGLHPPRCAAGPGLAPAGHPLGKRWNVQPDQRHTAAR
jgi:hypothetical protein